MSNKIEIGEAEAGQNVLRFLERSLSCPRSLIYRWLRSGEIRVNSGRVKPELVLEAGDILRLPPQALLMMDQNKKALGFSAVRQEELGPDLPIVYQDDYFLILNKPFGLAVQGGTGQTDDISLRLKKCCTGNVYVPAPAHRLDLYSSGLLVCGKSHESQTWLHSLLRASKEELQRSYLFWVAGDASKAFAGQTLCEDLLIQQSDADGRERMQLAAAGSDVSKAKEAKAIFHCREVREHPELGTVSLMEGRLLTGRKHQIRVQMSGRGFSLLGDGRYGGKTGVGMKLHAFRLLLPAYHKGNAPLVFTLMPCWDGFFAVGDNKNV